MAKTKKTAPVAQLNEYEILNKPYRAPTNEYEIADRKRRRVLWDIKSGTEALIDAVNNGDVILAQYACMDIERAVSKALKWSRQDWDYAINERVVSEEQRRIAETYRNIKKNNQSAGEE